MTTRKEPEGARIYVGMERNMKYQDNIVNRFAVQSREDNVCVFSLERYPIALSFCGYA